MLIGSEMEVSGKNPSFTPKFLPYQFDTKPLNLPFKSLDAYIFVIKFNKSLWGKDRGASWAGWWLHTHTRS